MSQRCQRPVFVPSIGSTFRCPRASQSLFLSTAVLVGTQASQPAATPRLRVPSLAVTCVFSHLSPNGPSLRFSSFYRVAFAARQFFVPLSLFPWSGWGVQNLAHGSDWFSRRASQVLTRLSVTCRAMHSCPRAMAGLLFDCVET